MDKSTLDNVSKLLLKAADLVAINETCASNAIFRIAGHCPEADEAHNRLLISAEIQPRGDNICQVWDWNDARSHEEVAATMRRVALDE